jgi:hypothetical protein
VTSPESSQAPYNDLVEVPIGTFRHYMTFIAQHDLWDEATAALRSAGQGGVVLGGPQVNVIREFVTAKGAQLNETPEHAGALVVPECSVICPQPATPASVPHTTMDGGTPEAGTTNAGAPPQ